MEFAPPASRLFQLSRPPASDREEELLFMLDAAPWIFGPYAELDAMLQAGDGPDVASDRERVLLRAYLRGTMDEPRLTLATDHADLKLRPDHQRLVCRGLAELWAAQPWRVADLYREALSVVESMLAPGTEAELRALRLDGVWRLLDLGETEAAAELAAPLGPCFAAVVARRFADPFGGQATRQSPARPGPADPQAPLRVGYMSFSPLTVTGLGALLTRPRRHAVWWFSFAEDEDEARPLLDQADVALAMAGMDLYSAARTIDAAPLDVLIMLDRPTRPWAELPDMLARPPHYDDLLALPALPPLDLALSALPPLDLAPPSQAGSWSSERSEGGRVASERSEGGPHYTLLVPEPDGAYHPAIFRATLLSMLDRDPRLRLVVPEGLMELYRPLVGRTPSAAKAFADSPSGAKGNPSEPTATRADRLVAWGPGGLVPDAALQTWKRPSGLAAAIARSLGLPLLGSRETCMPTLHDIIREVKAAAAGDLHCKPEPRTMADDLEIYEDALSGGGDAFNPARQAGPSAHRGGPSAGFGPTPPHVSAGGGYGGYGGFGPAQPQAYGGGGYGGYGRPGPAPPQAYGGGGYGGYGRPGPAPPQAYGGGGYGGYGGFGQAPPQAYGGGGYGGYGGYGQAPPQAYGGYGQAPPQTYGGGGYGGYGGFGQAPPQGFAGSGLAAPQGLGRQGGYEQMLQEPTSDSFGGYVGHMGHARHGGPSSGPSSVAVGGHPPSRTGNLPDGSTRVMMLTGTSNEPQAVYVADPATVASMLSAGDNVPPFPILAAITPELARLVGDKLVSACMTDRLRLLCCAGPSEAMAAQLGVSAFRVMPHDLSGIDEQPGRGLVEIGGMKRHGHILTPDALRYDLIFASNSCADVDGVPGAIQLTFAGRKAAVYVCRADAAVRTAKAAAAADKPFVLVTLLGPNAIGNDIAEAILADRKLLSWFGSNIALTAEDSRVRIMPAGVQEPVEEEPEEGDEEAEESGEEAEESGEEAEEGDEEAEESGEEAEESGEGAADGAEEGGEGAEEGGKGAAEGGEGAEERGEAAEEGGELLTVTTDRTAMADMELRMRARREAMAFGGKHNAIETREPCYLGFEETTEERRALRELLAEDYTWRVPYASASQHLFQLSRHKFCVCPEGPRVPDTARVWECLYLGVVPVLRRSAWSRAFEGKIPAVFVDSWEEARWENLQRFDGKVKAPTSWDPPRVFSVGNDRMLGAEPSGAHTPPMLTVSHWTKAILAAAGKASGGGSTEEWTGGAIVPVQSGRRRRGVRR